MPTPIDVTLRASAAVTESGQGASVDLRPPAPIGDGLERRALVLLLEATAVDGVLGVAVQTSPTGGSWREVGRFDALPGVGYQRLTFCPVERYARVVWQLEAGESATFSALGQAEVVYADLEDFYRWGLPRVAVQDVQPPDLVTAALLAASNDAQGSIPPRYRSTLVSPFPYILRQRVCELAIGPVLGVRGHDPDDAAMARYEYALKWFERIAAGLLEPPWIEPPPEESTTSGRFAMASDPSRGW
jgi:hypothetical protein